MLVRPAAFEKERQAPVRLGAKRIAGSGPQLYDQKENAKMSQLTIKDREAGDVTILDLSGKITIGEGSVQLREAVRKLLDDGKKKLLLNLGDVSYVDSSGIGELVSSYTTTNNNGGQLKLLNQTKKIHDLLTITKLLTVFETFNDEQAAVSSYK